MQNLSPISIVKASGTKEPFDEEKVIRSLTLSGLSKDIASQTLDYLKSNLKEDMNTDSIFGKVSSYLQQNAPLENYLNYGLKRAVMDMGPSGYPFEVLVSDLLKKEDYETEVGVVTLGKCVSHEIDVIAQKGDNKYFIECKYHNSPGYKTDIQVALYTNARFQDVDMAQKQSNPEQKNFGWLITNTKVTSEVIDYARCVDLLVTTWNYPEGNNLQDRIITSGLHPVTLLYQIQRSKVSELLHRDIVTCARLKSAILNDKVNDILSPDEKAIILKDINIVCKDNE